jgi:hypothetical protein
MNEINNKLLHLGPIILSILILASNANTVFSQNLTTNASNSDGNISTTVNQTGSQLGQNVSSSMGNANQQANETVAEVSNQSSGNQSRGVNQSAGAVGSAQELSRVLGNNSQMLQNNTPIGSTPTVGNATESSANITLDKLGENTSETTSGLLNKTEDVAKKVIGGAADVLTNITGEIKKGVGAK